MNVQYLAHRLKGAPILGAVAVGERGPFGIREDRAFTDGPASDGTLAAVSIIEDFAAAYASWDQEYEDMVAAERDADLVPCPAGEHWVPAHDPDGSAVPCPCYMA